MELPREKLIMYGADKLSDQELLAIIIGSGNGKYSVFDIANNIIKKINNITELKKINYNTLTKINGIGKSKAIMLMALIELSKRITYNKPIYKTKLNNSNLIFNNFRYIFKDEKQEMFLAIYLDTHKCLIKYRIIFKGTIDKAIVHPREIFNEAITISASSIIIMHNHPSGELVPSIEDKNLTNNLVRSGIMLSIPILDHIITDGNEYYSFYQNKLI